MPRRDEVVRGKGRLRHSSPLPLEGNPQICHCVLGQGMPRRDEVIRGKGRLRHPSPLPLEENPQICHCVLGQGMPRRDEVIRGKGRLRHPSPLPLEGNPQIRHCVLGQGMPRRDERKQGLNAGSQRSCQSASRVSKRCGSGASIMPTKPASSSSFWKTGCKVNVLSRPRRFEKRPIRESALTSISSTG